MKTNIETLIAKIAELDESFSVKNPKYDIFHKGNYVASTNWSITAKHAKAVWLENNPAHKSSDISVSKNMKESIDEAIASSTISKDEAAKPFHVIKFSKDTLGKYVHHHASYDSKEDADAALLTQKQKPKGSYTGHKVVSSGQLTGNVRLTNESSDEIYITFNAIIMEKIAVKLEEKKREVMSQFGETVTTGAKFQALPSAAAKTGTGFFGEIKSNKKETSKSIPLRFQKSKETK